MTSLRPFQFLVFCLLATHFDLYAVDDHAPTLPERITISFQAICIGNPISDISFYSGDKFITTTIYPNLRGPTYEYSGPKRLVFGKKNEAPAPLETWGTIQFSSRPAKQLLLFIPSKIGNPRYNIVSLPDDYDSFPFGSYQFLNLTNHPTYIKIGDIKSHIPPGEHRIIKGSFTSGQYYQTLIISSTEEGIKPVYANQIYYHENMRLLNIIVTDKTSDDEVVRLISIP